MNKINKKTWRAKNPKELATLICKYTDIDDGGNKVKEHIVVKIDKVGDSEWVEYDTIVSSVRSLRKWKKQHKI